MKPTGEKEKEFKVVLLPRVPIHHGKETWPILSLQKTTQGSKEYPEVKLGRKYPFSVRKYIVEKKWR